LDALTLPPPLHPARELALTRTTGGVDTTPLTRARADLASPSGAGRKGEKKVEVERKIESVVREIRGGKGKI
jgi:hypothetical protein